MAERARIVVFVLDSEGRPIPSATITIRDPGTTDAIAETLYAADDPDTSQLTNGAFFSGADGKVEAYLTNSKRADMLVVKSGYSSQTIPVDFSKSSLAGAHALTGSDHTVSGLTTDHVLKATGATTFGFGVDPLIDKITTAGDLIYGTGADAAARLGIGTAAQVLTVNSGATAPEWAAAASGFSAEAATVMTDNSTSSTSFVDLGTAGPAVTVTIGASGIALVVLTASCYNITDINAYMGFAVSGATTRGADAERSLIFLNSVSGKSSDHSIIIPSVSLTPGSNTFTAKYMVDSGGTAQFRRRHIAVIPL